MKGLLVKDFRILLQQKRTLMLMVLISILMLFAVSDISFITGYVTLMASFTAIGTISYDEMDNGHTFLFTLPISRKGYVLGKYILSVMACIIAWGIVNILMAVAMSGEYHVEDFAGAACVLVVALFMQFVMIPLQLKYGAEKSRLVYLLIVGIIVVVGVLLGQYSGYISGLENLSGWGEALGILGIAGIMLLITAIVAFVSLFISCKIMEKKQF